MKPHDLTIPQLNELLAKPAFTRTYRNSFYRPEHINNPYIKEWIEERGTPVEYNGFKLYQFSKQQVNIVKDGVCVGMVGTINAAKHRIDTNSPQLNIQ